MGCSRFIRFSRVGPALAALFFAGGLAGQPASDIAELQKRVTVASPAEKFAALIALSRTLETVDMGRAIDAARQARAAATWPHDEMIADARIATILRRRGDYVEAMTITRPALGRAAEVGDDVARMDLLLIFAQINGSIADSATSMDAYRQLIMLAEKIGDRYMSARGHLGFSVIFGDTNEFKKAREEEELVIRIAREIGNPELEADGLNNLGNNFRAAGEFDRAREAHERAMAIRLAAGARRPVGDSLVNLGEVARARGDFPAALDYTQRALDAYVQLGLKRYQANARVQLAATLRALGRFDEALAHLNQGFTVAQGLNSHRLFADYQLEFSRVYEARGDSGPALEAQRRYNKENEAALSEKTLLQIATLKARYEAEHREHELAQLRAAQTAHEAELRVTAAELAHEHRLRTALVDGILLFLAASGVFVLVRYGSSGKRPGSDDDPPAGDPFE